MPNEITILLKNRMYSQAVITALLAAGFGLMEKTYTHAGCELHMVPPFPSAPDGAGHGLLPREPVNHGALTD